MIIRLINYCSNDFQVFLFALSTMKGKWSYGKFLKCIGQLKSDPLTIESSSNCLLFLVIPMKLKLSQTNIIKILKHYHSSAHTRKYFN